MTNSKKYIHKVIIVDSNSESSESLRAILNKEQCESVVFSDPGEAVEAVARHEFDLAFVDINHPDIDGPLLAGTLKSHNQGLTVVMTTKSGNFHEAIRSIRVGAYDYLFKPFKRSEVALTLERYKLKRELKQRAIEAEQRHSLLLQHMPALIFIINKDMELQFINKALFPMLGYASEESSTDKNWILKLVHPDDRIKVARFFEHAFKTKLPFTAECRFIHRQGHILHTIIRSIPDPSRTLDHEDKNTLECVVMDITDRVLLEHSMLQDEKLKTLGAVTAELAHEIRNPLMAIGGFARRLIKKAPELAEAEIILNESKRLENLLNRINSYLSPMQIKREIASVNGLISGSIELVSRQVAEAGLNISLNLNESLPMACADSDQLKQIFVNLTLAAANTCVPDSRLVISSFHRDKDVIVTYTFTEAKKFALDPDRIFMPFEEGGESLGLYLSYRVLKHMGGLLAFNRVNGDYEFSITLPRFDMSISTSSEQEFDLSNKEQGKIHAPENFTPLLKSQWNKSHKKHEALALMMVGMDGSKSKPFGIRPQAKGTKSQVGAAISTAVQNMGGFVAKYSDFMYAVAIPVLNEKQLRTIAQTIIRLASALDAKDKETRAPDFSVSIGIAVKKPEMNSTSRDLISDATDCLRKALEQGPCGIVINSYP